MKVVVRSSSLAFAVLSIVFDVPITRVKRLLEEPRLPRKPPEREILLDGITRDASRVSFPRPRP